MRRAAAATGPIAIQAGTARVLGGQYGYIEEVDGGWVLTPLGRSHVEGERTAARRREAEKQLTKAGRQWANRVVAWLQAHETILKDDAPAWYSVSTFAHHVAACDHAGIEPVSTQKWADGDQEWIEREVRGAAECLRDYDTAMRLAGDRGVGVTVSYEANAKVPRSRGDAAVAATDTNVVSLGTYRERRPGPGAA